MVSKLIDISIPIHPHMVTYPGDPGVIFEPALDMGCGELANVSLLHMGSQTGTHMDTPHHILNNGITVEQLPLEVCYGPAHVVEIDAHIQTIDAACLEGCLPPGCERLILKTRNSLFWNDTRNTFREDYAALTEDGAALLARYGIKLVGIDYLSIELYHSTGLKAHKALLQHNIVILESLDLRQAAPGPYSLAAFPVKYHGLDGAPTRAVLISE